MLKIEIAKPCDMTWTAMKGDEQVRHCGACRKNVYNISQMTEAEVEALIQRTEGHFCARVYRRTDGRVLTADCPQGVSRVRRQRALAVTAALVAVSALLALMPVYGGVKPRRHTPTPPPEEPIGYSNGIVARPVYREDQPTMGKVRMPDVRLGEIAVIPKHGK